MHYRKKGSLLRKGIAAFLLFLMASSSFAFADDSVEPTDATVSTDSAEQEIMVLEQKTEAETEVASTENDEVQAETEAPEEFESVGTVELEGEDEAADEAIADMTSEGDIMLFSQGKASSKKVTLYSRGKVEYESFQTHLFRVKCDGKSYVAYCIEPTKGYGGKDSFTAKPYNSKLMTKALYYSYGNPGYSKKTASYLSGVSRKSCYKGDKGVYCLCHIMLSYIYDGQKSKTDAFEGCSSSTKKVVKNLIAKIKSWPNPPGKSRIGLSSKSVNAEWNNESWQQETPEITVGGTKGNYIKVPVPKGATVHKGDKKATSGSMKVSVNESFWISAPATLKGKYKSPAMEAAITDFQPYLITPKSNKQKQLFNMSTVNSISYSIDWADFGRVELIKTSSSPDITDGNSYYSLEGAKYGLYFKDTDRECAELITDSDGQAAAENIPYGEYYLKEKDASPGYELDIAAHDITVSSPAQSETVLEKPVVPDITTSASVAETGESSAEEGGVLNISDTVKYSGVEPGLEYRIEGRLVNKSTGEDVEGTLSEVLFTPEEEAGSLKMDYELDSSGLGGSTVVAFEKLYQGDNLIARHEDINNEAESVVIRKAKEKKTVPPPDESPDMGDGFNLLILAFALALSGLLGLAVIMKKN